MLPPHSFDRPSEDAALVVQPEHLEIAVGVAASEVGRAARVLKRPVEVPRAPKACPGTSAQANPDVEELQVPVLPAFERLSRPTQRATWAYWSSSSGDSASPTSAFAKSSSASSTHGLRPPRAQRRASDDRVGFAHRRELFPANAPSHKLRRRRRRWRPGGCVLTARFSENPDCAVCLVEAGPDYGPYEDGG
jgi:hypothetical protein